jgi:RNA polymerase sigma-70 factor (ECF subfamily)
MSGASPSPEFSVELIALLPRLRRYARALTGDRASADDLVQDTLERAWARYRQWQPGTNLRAWLFSIMHNRRIDVLRGDRLVPVDDPAERQDEHRAQTGAADLLGDIEPIDLERAFGRLPVEHREILLLVAVEQQSYAEAAATLAVPIGTVMSRLSRARQRLRAELGEPGERGAPRRGGPAGGAGAGTAAGAQRLKRVK